MALTLFLIFFKLGFFSFGGGYTMIPLVEQELNARGFDLPAEIIADTAAIAGIAPGPVGINLAIAFGYELGGIGGVIAAALGVMLPSLIVVLVVAFFFKAVYDSEYFRGAMRGLKPFIVGITLFAAFSMAHKNGMFGPDAGKAVLSIIVAAASLVVLLKTKIHPIFLICAGAAAGIFLF